MSHNLHPMAHKGHIYAEIVSSMYDLPQVGILPNKLLAKWLANMDTTKCSTHLVYGNMPPTVFNSHSLWMTLQYNMWVLMTTHSISSPPSKINTKCPWTCQPPSTVESQQSGTTTPTLSNSASHYNTYTVKLRMPGNVEVALHKFQHPTPSSQNAPIPHNMPQYGVKIQLTEPADTQPPPLSKEA